MTTRQEHPQAQRQRLRQGVDHYTPHPAPVYDKIAGETCRKSHIVHPEYVGVFVEHYHAVMHLDSNGTSSMGQRLNARLELHRLYEKMMGLRA